MSLFKCTVRQYEFAKNNKAFVLLSISRMDSGKCVTTRVKLLSMSM